MHIPPSLTIQIPRPIHISLSNDIPLASLLTHIADTDHTGCALLEQLLSLISCTQDGHKNQCNRPNRIPSRTWGNDPDDMLLDVAAQWRQSRPSATPTAPAPHCATQGWVNANWRQLPHHTILHILEFNEVVASPDDTRHLIGRFQGDPCRVYRLLFRSIECSLDANGFESAAWRLVLSQVRHVSLLYYSGIGTRRQPLFAHLDSYATRATMPQLRAIDIDERTYSAFQSLQWNNPYLLTRVRHASLHCYRFPTSVGQVLRKFPRVKCCAVDIVETRTVSDLIAADDRYRGMSVLCDSNSTLVELRAGFSCAEQLRHVVLHCPHITSIVLMIDEQRDAPSSDWFHCLRQVSHLKRFHINALALVLEIDRVPCCPSLTDLSINDVVVKSLEGLRDMTQLEHLKLEIADCIIPGVLELTFCTNLRTLELTGHGPVEGDLLIALTTLARQGLRCLTMDTPVARRDSWKLGDEGVRTVLRHATALESLSLRDHSITPRMLVDVIRCHSLRDVVLQNVSFLSKWSRGLIRTAQYLGRLRTLRVSEW